jgi:hypothetical protein
LARTTIAYSDGRYLVLEKEIENAFAKPEVTPEGPGHSLSCWIYLASSAVATLGWFWFLARIGLWLFQIVWGF